MANIKSAIKRARQNPKRRERNASDRSRLRTYIKNVLKAIDSKDIVLAEAAFKKATSIIDRSAKKLIHKNKAARYKSKLNKKIKVLKTAA